MVVWQRWQVVVVNRVAEVAAGGGCAGGRWSDWGVCKKK